MTATAASTAASVRFGRRRAVSSDALKERLTRIRLTITTTSEKNASARTSGTGMPDSQRHDVNGGNERKGQRSLQQAPDDQRPREQRFVGRARRAAHDVVFLGLGLEYERADRIDDHFEKGDMDRSEQDGQAEHQRQQRQARNGDVNGKDEAHRLAQIVVDAAAETDRLDDGAEIVVEQHDGGSFARHVRSAPAHGDADMGGLQRRRIVDAIAGHRDDLAISLVGVDDAQLLVRRDPREHTGRFDPAGQFHLVQLLELFAGHEIAAFEPGLMRDRACGRRIVTGDHDGLDAGGPAFADRLDDAGA